MDETPIKAGRKERPPPQRGKMKTGYFWPIYGDRDEIAFPFATTRGSAVVREALKGYVGVLLTDGYEVYERYAKAVERHRACAVLVAYAAAFREGRDGGAGAGPGSPGDHRPSSTTRRQRSRRSRSSPEKVLAYRAEHVRPIVDRFFESACGRRWRRSDLASDEPVHEGCGLRACSGRSRCGCFSSTPTCRWTPIIWSVRSGRSPSAGRTGCSAGRRSERSTSGSSRVLLSTCRVHGVDPYTYLVDVLQRIDTHPAKDVAWLTPRLWKERYAENPLRSEIDRA